MIKPDLLLDPDDRAGSAKFLYRSMVIGTWKESDLYIFSQACVYVKNN